LLTRKEEKKLTRRAASGDEEAKKKLVLYNHRLVLSIAKDYKGKGVAFEDLIMAGFEGLLKAIEGFKPELGNKLSTYSTWWIRQRILKELDENSTTIRFPGYIRNLRRKVRQSEEEGGEEYTNSQIQEEFDVTEKVASRVKLMATMKSLDEEVAESGSVSLKDLVENPRAEEPPEASIKERKSDRLEETLDTALSDRERRIIKLYYGLEDYKPRTLKEVGKVFSVSQERIRQLREQALDKLNREGDLVAVNNKAVDR
jgi:RNA polymerase primary sigma factor